MTANSNGAKTFLRLIFCAGNSFSKRCAWDGERRIGRKNIFKRFSQKNIFTISYSENSRWNIRVKISSLKAFGPDEFFHKFENLKLKENRQIWKSAIRKNASLPEKYFAFTEKSCRPRKRCFKSKNRADNYNGGINLIFIRRAGNYKSWRIQ